MQLHTTLFGKSYQFSSVKDVLAKANEPKSGDVLAGIAAADAKERVAAKIVLSELTVRDLTEHPAVPYETDEVTRYCLDYLDTNIYRSIASLSMGELRDHLLLRICYLIWLRSSAADLRCATRKTREK